MFLAPIEFREGSFYNKVYLTNLREVLLVCKTPEGVANNHKFSLNSRYPLPIIHKKDEMHFKASMR